MNASHPFHIMVKPNGPICNMDCTYCYYLEKENLYPRQHRFAMRDEILENFIRQYIEAIDLPEIHFAWQGGEPTLLGLSFFQKVISFQKKYSNGKKIFNALQTNGTRIDETWAEFLAGHQFLVGISIDGPQEIHDALRVYKGGQSTFDRVMQAIELFKTKKVEFNTLTCVHSKNMDSPLTVYRFLKEIGSWYLQFIPVVEREYSGSGEIPLRLVLPGSRQPASVTGWSVDALKYGKFLSAIFDEWVQNDVGSVFVQIFEVALENWMGMPAGLCVFRETCGDALVMEHNGDVYSCDHYVYPEYRLGNLMNRSLREMADSPFQQNFGRSKKDDLPKYCRECDYLFACRGECPKHRFIRTPDGEKGLNYLCEGYKYFFAHIDPYMKFMSNELKNRRSPANVMEWAKQNK